MKLCIDAGHGFSNRSQGTFDPGAVGGGLQEADIALQWALAGRWIAEEFGISTWLTRDDDRDVSPVGSRARRAEEAGCTHFLSIHCDAGPILARGTTTYVPSNSNRSDKFAPIVQACALVAMQVRDRGIRTEKQSQHKTLAVLRFNGPCALLETGFISNPYDRKRMAMRDVRVKFWSEFYKRLKSG